jgi:F420-0:gamma-glutamyl ligase
MAKGLAQSLEAQITSKMHELIASTCVVNFRQKGDRRGKIERIESLALGKDFPESFDRSQFKVHLTSGDIVIVSGSAISEIESTVASRRSKPTKKAAGKKTRKARTKSTLAQNRKSIATKASKAASRARTRKAKGRRLKNG